MLWCQTHGNAKSPYLHFGIGDKEMEKTQLCLHRGDQQRINFSFNKYKIQPNWRPRYENLHSGWRKLRKPNTVLTEVRTNARKYNAVFWCEGTGKTNKIVLFACREEIKNKKKNRALLSLRNLKKQGKKHSLLLTQKRRPKETQKYPTSKKPIN